MLEIEPPLTPISDERDPDHEAVDDHRRRGRENHRAIRQLSRPNRSLMAMMVTTTMNTILNTAPGAK